MIISYLVVTFIFLNSYHRWIFVFLIFYMLYFYYIIASTPVQVLCVVNIVMKQVEFFCHQKTLIHCVITRGIPLDIPVISGIVYKTHRDQSGSESLRSCAITMGTDDSGIDEMKERILVDLSPYLCRSLGDPSRYIPYLMARDINLLDATDKDMIKAEQTSQRKKEVFVEILKRKGACAFDGFVDVLLEVRDESHIARKLQQALKNEQENARSCKYYVYLNVECVQWMNGGLNKGARMLGEGPKIEIRFLWNPSTIIDSVSVSILLLQPTSTSCTDHVSHESHTRSHMHVNSPELRKAKLFTMVYVVYHFPVRLVVHKVQSRCYNDS